MKIENAELGYSCIVPDRPTVRQQLVFFAAAGGASEEDKYIRYWEAARALISDWQCPALPDINTSLDDITNPDQAMIILRVGLRVVAHMNQLENIPPNS